MATKSICQICPNGPEILHSLALLALVVGSVAACSSPNLVRQDAEAIMALPHEQWLTEAAHPRDPIVELAARDFKEVHNWIRPVPQSLSQVAEALCYEGQLKTDVLKGTVYLFSYCRREPTPYTLIRDYADSLGTLYETARPDSSAINRELVRRLAAVLEVNPTIEDQALEAALFIVNAQDLLSYRTLRVLENWRGITHSRAYPVPDSIRRIIKEPVVEGHRTGLTVDLYVWKLTSTALTRLTLVFEGEQVHFRLHQLGKYGYPSIVL